jgi:replicative DNA helicase
MTRTTPGPVTLEARPAEPMSTTIGCDEAEQAWLGCLLHLDHLTAAGHLATVDVEDLAVPQHRIILTAIRDLVLAEQPTDPDPVTVLGQLRRTGAATSFVSGTEPGGTLIALRAAAPVPAQATYYARIIREHSWRRRVEEAGVRLQQMAAGVPIDELWQRVRDELASTLLDAQRAARLGNT